MTKADMTIADQRELAQFPATVISLALPVTVQSLISAAVNYADVLMLSHVGQDAMSAVSQANQITFVLTLFYLGLSTGVTILSAQYWGSRNSCAIGQTLGLAMKCSMTVSAVFFLAAEGIPGVLMRLYTPDAALIGYGVTYLRILGVGYLAMGMSQMLLSSMKSVEQTGVCAVISSGGLLLNIGLNAIVIFILFPDNGEMAVAGTAVATVIARAAEAISCWIWMKTRNPVPWSLRWLKRGEPRLKSDFWHCTWKVQLNYLIWGGALSASAALVGYVSSDMVSANAVASSVRNLVIVGCTGMSTAGGILLGKYLGAGRLALAKQAGDRLRLWSILLGAAAGAVILVLRPVCLKFANLNEDASELLSIMLLICSVYCIGKSFNSTMVGGIFCAGGDTWFGLVCDTVGMWCVILPLAYLCAFRWQLPPKWIYLVLCLDEFVKMPFVALHYSKYKWLNNLTRKTDEEECTS
ncbi:MAG: MATE family efflux transporter [Firmicutes bacterium]|nr:MATE family efflux transporter [Bacillota bacterium]